MSIIGRLRSVISAPVPLVATYKSDGRIPAQHIKNQKFAGLLWLHVADQQHGSIVTTYWRSEDDFKRDGEALGLGLNATLETDGFVRDPHDARPLWKRARWQTLYAIFVTIVALVSGWATVSAQIHRWKAEPDLEVRSERAIHDILDDVPPDETFYIISRSMTSQRVNPISATIQPQVASHLRVTPLRVRELRPDAEMRARVTMEPIPAGTYKLRLTARAQAGDLRNPEVFEDEMMLRVWRPWPQLHKLVLEQYDDSRATFRYVILVGNAAPDGILLDVIVTSVGGISDVITDARGSTTERSWSIDSSSRGAEVGKTTIRLPASEAFRQRTYRLIMLGQHVDWNHVSAATSVHVTLPDRKETF